MYLGRRRLLGGAIATLATSAQAPKLEAKNMYGLIGRMLAAPGKRDALIELLLQGIGGMPGCLSYVVAQDAADENAIWITEVWDSKESHGASLSLPEVKKTIAAARPLIAGFDKHIVTAPVSGHGLAGAKPAGV